MTNQELQELRARCLYAFSHGYNVAKADEIAKELIEEGASNPGVKSSLPVTLLAMIKEVEQVFAGEPEEPAKVAPVSHVEPKVLTDEMRKDLWDENPPQFAMGALDPADHPDKDESHEPNAES